MRVVCRRLLFRTTEFGRLCMLSRSAVNYFALFQLFAELTICVTGISLRISGGLSGCRCGGDGEIVGVSLAEGEPDDPLIARRENGTRTTSEVGHLASIPTVFPSEMNWWRGRVRRVAARNLHARKSSRANVESSNSTVTNLNLYSQACYGRSEVVLVMIL